jgi:SAM-dependent methyltransferase
MTCLPAQFVAPYRGLAPNYDGALGERFFERTRAAFQRLQREYGFTFRSAADVGCGTGLFARHLAREWRVPVFAVDRSPAMLAVARRNCRGESVWVLQQDLRCLCLPRPVDLITANYDVLNHLVEPGEVRRALRRIRDHLTPGGHFYADLITPCLGLPAGRRVSWLRATPRGEVRQVLLWDSRRRLLGIEVISRQAFEGCVRIERHLERTYELAEIAGWLAEAGLTLRGVHDEATVEFADACAPRLLLLAERA